MSGGNVLVSYNSLVAVLDPTGALVGTVNATQLGPDAVLTSDAPGRALAVWQPTAYGQGASSLLV